MWIDLEMTGLDPARDTILEAACLITDSNFKVIAEAPRLVIAHSSAQLAAMNDWCREHHGASGLSAEAAASSLSLAEAELILSDFVRQHCLPGTAPLCGNSVHVDRAFLLRHMPALTAQLHYRIIDVSSFKEVLRRRYGAAAAYSKQLSHRALDDIRESIGELQFYLREFFKEPTL